MIDDVELWLDIFCCLWERIVYQTVDSFGERFTIAEITFHWYVRFPLVQNSVHRSVAKKQHPVSGYGYSYDRIDICIFIVERFYGKTSPDYVSFGVDYRYIFRVRHQMVEIPDSDLIEQDSHHKYDRWKYFVKYHQTCLA